MIVLIIVRELYAEVCASEIVGVLLAKVFGALLASGVEVTVVVNGERRVAMITALESVFMPMSSEDAFCLDCEACSCWPTTM